MSQTSSLSQWLTSSSVVTHKESVVVPFPKEHNMMVAAREGEYGAKAYDRIAIYADAMLAAIVRELPDVTAFTRDDLMYLTTFGHVATITRYNYVSRAIRYALAAKKVLEVGRGLYILAGTKRKYQQSVHTTDEYDDTIAILARDYQIDNPDHAFGVADLLPMWVNDQHLSTSTKRTLLREGLRRLEANDIVQSEGFMLFVYTGK
jgi:hypothetical protein